MCITDTADHAGMMGTMNLGTSQMLVLQPINDQSQADICYCATKDEAYEHGMVLSGFWLEPYEVRVLTDEGQCGKLLAVFECEVV